MTSSERSVRSPQSAIHIALFLLITNFFLTSCSHREPFVASAASPIIPPARPKAIQVLSQDQLAAIKPNELGRIPILMYHSIGASAIHGSRYDRHGLNISCDTFRRQLELMRDAHWYPVNMHDILTSQIDIPAGKTPVVLTFDDARGTQFHYLPDGTIDKSCALGILIQFHKEHRDWPLKGTFYVLPQSAWNPVPFWQRGLERKKLGYLTEHGFEIGNHTTTHHLMTHMSPETVAWELAECAHYVKERAPLATMDTMALPGGAAPTSSASSKKLISGSYNKTHYYNRCVLMAWGGPEYAYADKRYDPMRVRRIGSIPWNIEHWMRRMQSFGDPPEYVSDGNPAVLTLPEYEEAYVDRGRLNGVRVVAYTLSKVLNKSKPKHTS